MLNFLPFVVIALICTARLSAGDLVVVEDGRARAEIVVAAERPRMTTLAALELRHFVQRITGAMLPIVTSPSKTDNVKIYVGRSPDTDRHGIADEGLKYGAYRIASGPDWLVLLGHDEDFDHTKLPWPLKRNAVPEAEAKWTHATAGKTDAAWGFPFTSGFKALWSPIDFPEQMTARYGDDFVTLWPKRAGTPAGFWEHDLGGSLNAVYALLRGWGVRWYMPGQLGEVLPTTKMLVCKPINKTVAPDYAMRDWNWYNFSGFAYDDVIWARRLGMNTGHDLVGPLKGPHGLVHVMSAMAMKEKHPEYYALLGGKRDIDHRRGGTPCFTSPGLEKETVKYLRYLSDTHDLPSVARDLKAMKGVSLGDTGEQSQSQNKWRTPAIEHITLYVQAQFLWDADQDADALLDEYCRLFYGPAAKAMHDAILFAEHNLAVKDQSRTGGRANPMNVPLSVSLRLRDKLEQSRQQAGDTIYGRRIAAIQADLKPKEQLIADDQQQRKALADARAKAPVARAQSGDDLSTANKYVLKDNITGEKPDVLTEFRVGWAGDAIVFDVVCNEPRMKQLRVAQNVFEGDNIAISLETPLHSYYHLEINPDGTVADGNPGPDWQSLAEVKTEQAEDSWRVQVRIPVVGADEASSDPRHRVGGAKPTADAPWYFNVGRYRVANLEKPELQAFSPTKRGWHQPTRFGKLLAAQEATVLRDETELVLVAHGQNLTPIILPTKPTRFTKIAAADLADYIEKVGGERPKIMEGPPNPVPQHAIWVGFQPVLKDLFPATDFELNHPEEILLKCDGKHLAIVGRDVWDPLTNKMKIMGGKTEAERKDYLAGFAEANGDVEGFQYEYGTVNAVYTFLQDKLGIRWLWPGAAGEVVPQQTKVTIGPFELRYHPKVRMRQTVYAQLAIYKKGGKPGQSGGDWVRRQRIQLDSLYAPSGGHGFTEWYAAYHKTHPEYFALQSDGTREYKGEPRHAKLCQSNPAVWEQWLRIMKEMIAKNPHRTVFNVAANDSTFSGICCCERCKAWDHPNAAKMIWYYPGGKELIGNATTDREVTFANLLARKLKERYPDKDYKVLIQAYGGAASPPIKAIPDANVIVSSVAIPFSNLEGWSKVTTGGLIWRPNFADPAHFKTGGPPDITGSGALLQKAAACGATGVSLDMLWSWWATQGPMYYLMAQLAWNPDRPVDEIMDDYYRAGFGPAAGDIEAYWNLLESNRIAIQLDKSTASVKSWAEAFNPEFFKTAYALLDKSAAKAAQAGKEYSARVAFVRAGLDYLRLNTENQALVRQIIEAKGPDPVVREKMRSNWKLIEEINQKYPEALSITRVSELGYIHPAADHQEIERKLQSKAALRNRKNARLRELIPK